MTIDNRDIIEKADMALADLTTAGKLLADQANAFIRVAINASTLLPLMSDVKMRASEAIKEKIRFGSRVLRAGTEASALPVGSRVKPDLSKVTLTASLVKAETRISYETLEDNIEQGTLSNTIRDLIAERVGLDLEDLAINGDTASADELLKVLDGFLKQATSNTVAGGSATLSRSLLKTILKTMPSEFRRDKRAMRFITADEAVIDYHESIGDRATGLGDSKVETDQAPKFHGMQLHECPVFPTNQGGGSNETSLLFTDPANMAFGVHRDITFETDKDISAGVLITVVTARVAFKYVHEPAVVKATAIRAV